MARPNFCARYGPWALVAGASEGLGAEFAAQLAARGLNLVLVARRQSPLDELSAQLRSEHSIEVRALALDLARDDASEALVEATSDLEIGLLIYNAAYSMIGHYLDISLEDHQRELVVNCRTPLALTHTFGRVMVKRGHGGIVLLSSMSGSQGSAMVVNYGATKAYNWVLAEGLWDELTPLGVDVLACCPAPVDTPRYRASAPRTSVPALSSRQVVSETLAYLGKGPIIIPGLSWRFASFFMQRIMPRKAAIKIMGNTTRKMYEEAEPIEKKQETQR